MNASRVTMRVDIVSTIVSLLEDEVVQVRAEIKMWRKRGREIKQGTKREIEGRWKDGSNAGWQLKVRMRVADSSWGPLGQAARMGDGKCSHWQWRPDLDMSDSEVDNTDRLRSESQC